LVLSLSLPAIVRKMDGASNLFVPLEARDVVTGLTGPQRASSFVALISLALEIDEGF
jgi:hypothetical protein